MTTLIVTLATACYLRNALNSGPLRYDSIPGGSPAVSSGDHGTGRSSTPRRKASRSISGASDESIPAACSRSRTVDRTYPMSRLVSRLLRQGLSVLPRFPGVLKWRDPNSNREHHDLQSTPPLNLRVLPGFLTYYLPLDRRRGRSYQSPPPKSPPPQSPPPQSPPPGSLPESPLASPQSLPESSPASPESSPVLSSPCCVSVSS